MPSLEARQQGCLCCREVVQPSRLSFLPNIKTPAFIASDIIVRRKAIWPKWLNWHKKTWKSINLARSVRYFFENGYLVNWEEFVNWLRCSLFFFFFKGKWTNLDKSSKVFWGLFAYVCVCVYSHALVSTLAREFCHRICLLMEGSQRLIFLFVTPFHWCHVKNGSI